MFNIEINTREVLKKYNAKVYEITMPTSSVRVTSKWFKLQSLGKYLGPKRGIKYSLET